MTSLHWQTILQTQTHHALCMPDKTGKCGPLMQFHNWSISLALCVRDSFMMPWSWATLTTVQCHTIPGMLPGKWHKSNPQDVKHFLDRRQKQKVPYNQRTHNLDMFNKGQDIIYYDQRKGH